MFVCLSVPRVMSVCLSQCTKSDVCLSVSVYEAVQAH